MSKIEAKIRKRFGDRFIRRPRCVRDFAPVEFLGFVTVEEMARLVDDVAQAERAKVHASYARRKRP